MMTPEKMAEKILDQAEKIATVDGSAKSAHKRIDKLDSLTESIHKMAANTESMMVEMKNLRSDMLDGLKGQGARIGVLETTVLSLSSLTPKIDTAYKGVIDLEKEPGKRSIHKWDKLAWLVVGSVIPLIIGYIIANFIGG